jgi:hypothetical protein
LERNTIRALDFASQRAEDAEAHAAAVKANWAEDRSIQQAQYNDLGAILRAVQAKAVADITALNESFRAERHAERDGFEARMQDVCATVGRLQGELDRANAELSRLTTKPEPQAARSKLTQAIRDNARMPDGTIDRRLVSHFRGQANRLINEGMGVEEVIESLGTWQTTERDDAMTADKIVAAFNDGDL